MISHRGSISHWKSPHRRHRSANPSSGLARRALCGLPQPPSAGPPKKRSARGSGPAARAPRRRPGLGKCAWAAEGGVPGQTVPGEQGARAGWGRARAAARAPRRQSKERPTEKPSHLPEAARPKASSPATHEPARATGSEDRAQQAAASSRGLLSSSRPQSRDSPPHPTGLRAPARVSPRASRVGGGVRRGARGGWSWKPRCEVPRRRGSVPWVPRRQPGALGPSPHSHGGAVPRVPGGRGSGWQGPRPRPSLPPLPPAIAQRGRAFLPRGAETDTNAFPLPLSSLEVKNCGRAPHQYQPLRTRGDAASNKKFKA